MWQMTSTAFSVASTCCVSIEVRRAEPNSWKGTSSKYEDTSHETISESAWRTAVSVASDRGRHGTSPRGHRKPWMSPKNRRSPTTWHQQTFACCRSVGSTRKVHVRTIAKHVVTLSWCIRSIHLVVQAFRIWLPFQKINELQCCCGDVHLCVPPLSGPCETEEQRAVSTPDINNTTLSPSMTVGVK